MKRIRVSHTTGFRYENDAATSYNEARMLPATREGQFVLSAHLETRPNAPQYAFTDYWGTRVTAFEVLSPHRELVLSAMSLVELVEAPHEGCDIGWEELGTVSRSSVEVVEQLRQTPRTDPPAELVELARELVAAAPGPCAAAEAICRRIGEEVEYVTGATAVDGTASEAWAERSGVCQDIAHIALGALRAVGIPARYVSGYLHPRPDAPIGETVIGESHAWVEWFCGTWRGYDPTNLIAAGDRHVYVGNGRDYDDVAPIRGVYAGTGERDAFVTVEITREA